MNIEIFKLVNSMANENKILDWIMIFFSKDLMYIIMAITVLIYFLGIKNNDLESRKIVFSTIVFTIINICLSSFIGVIYYEDRPFVHNKVNLLYPHTSNASFPSDHAIGTMSIAVGLGEYSKIISAILMALSIAIGLSRLYVGHHYPVDILGAYVLVFLLNYIYNAKLRNKIEMMYEKIENKITSSNTINI